MDAIKSANYNSKTKFTLPQGAEIVKKDFNVEIDEIENGFIITKRYNIQYSMNGQIEHSYHVQRWYSKKNPMKIEMKETPLEDKIT